MYNNNQNNNNSSFQSHLSPDFFNSSIYFSTQDTAMTCWLMTCGFTFESVSTKDFNYTFIFKRTPELDKAAVSWATGSAIGNCFFFENNRRTLMKVIKKNR